MHNSTTKLPFITKVQDINNPKVVPKAKRQIIFKIMPKIFGNNYV